MSNRHDRRAAEARERLAQKRMQAATDFYNDYTQHLPEVPIDAPLKPGTVSHLVFFHDEACSIYRNGICNCDPDVTRHEEVERQ
jgi:hypothetical protein